MSQNIYYKGISFIADRFHAWSRRAHLAFAWPAGSTTWHVPDREHGWRGSMAAALQTSRHAHDERARQPIQRM